MTQRGHDTKGSVPHNCIFPREQSSGSMKRPWHTASHSILTALLLATIPVHAVIFYADGDPAYNTTAPGGSLTNSGWQFEGIWGGFLGTPIAPKYFITARHVGGSV